jgi:hypothetical protein
MKTILLKIIFPILLFITVISLSVHYHQKEINRYPSFIHAWAQADYYSISLGFTENGFDFFHPQTYILNKQFPDNYSKPYSNRITSIDFPIHQYIPALFMGVTGIYSPFWMRIYNLMYSLIGLLFLFLLARKLSCNVITPYAVVLFVSLSPIFIYYQATFIPTIPSLANAIVGYYFFFGYLINNKLKEFWLAILFFTLAALARTPFAIFLIAAMCHQLLLAIKSKRISYPAMIGYIVSFTAIGGYYLYNLHLRNVNGSIFLGNPSPPDSLQNFKDTFWAAYYQWKLHYYTHIHYIALYSISVAFAVALIFKKITLTPSQKALAIQTAIAGFGAILYAFLMTKQFRDHDYYWLDSLFLPIALLFILMVGAFSAKSKKSIAIGIILLLSFTVFAQREAHKRLNERRQQGDDSIQLTVENYANSDQLLDSLKIGKYQKILALGSYSTNIPLCRMRRQGYSVLYLNHDCIQQALTWPFDYIAVQNCLFINDVVNNYPEILSMVERVGGNEKITILKRSKNSVQRSIDELLGFSNRKPRLSEQINFEGKAAIIWQNTRSKEDLTNPYNRVGFVDSTNEWGVALTLKDSTLLQLQRTQPVFRARFFSKEKECSILLLASLKSDKEQLSNHQYMINLPADSGGVWHQIEVVLPSLYPSSNGKNEYIIYLWDVDKRSIAYDDITIDFY